MILPAKQTSQEKPSSSSASSTFKTKMGTENLFVEYDFCWWILGQKPNPYRNVILRAIYSIYAILVNVGLQIAWPIHLTIGLFYIQSATDIFRNLAINISVTFATVKSYIIWWNTESMHEIEEILTQLDERVIEPEDVDYFKKKVYPSARHIAYLLYFLCFGSAISSESAVVIAGLLGNWKLMYPAYFPFDPFGSSLLHFVAHTYQIVGVSFHMVQNFINDTYGGMCMALISGHVHLLGRRVARIGWDKTKSQQENNQLLLECIKDHKLLLRFRHKLIKIVSYCLLFQILIAAVSMCLVIVYILFYVNDAFTLIYYMIYFFGMPMEIFPSCYYGSKMEMEFQAFTHTIFDCNWLEQNDEFKRNFRIFTEQTLRPINIEAGGMVRVNLATFLSAFKLAYSLYSVVSQSNL